MYHSLDKQRNIGAPHWHFVNNLFLTAPLGAFIDQGPLHAHQLHLGLQRHLRRPSPPTPTPATTATNATAADAKGAGLDLSHYFHGRPLPGYDKGKSPDARSLLTKTPPAPAPNILRELEFCSNKNRVAVTRPNDAGSLISEFGNSNPGVIQRIETHSRTSAIAAHRPAPPVRITLKCCTFNPGPSSTLRALDPNHPRFAAGTANAVVSKPPPQRPFTRRKIAVREPVRPPAHNPPIPAASTPANRRLEQCTGLEIHHRAHVPSTPAPAGTTPVHSPPTGTAHVNELAERNLNE